MLRPPPPLVLLLAVLTPACVTEALDPMTSGLESSSGSDDDGSCDGPAPSWLALIDHDRWRADIDAAEEPLGAILTLHLHNHGYNTWHFHELSVLPSS